LVFSLSASRPKFLYSFLGSIGYALALTFPWLIRPSRVLGGRADNFEYVWRLWWFKERLLHGGNPLFAPHVFYPFGFNLATGELTPLMIVLGTPVTLLLGEVAGYNFLILSAFTIAAFSMFCFAWDLTKDTRAAIAAGLIYAAAPFLTTHALGHLPLLGYCWFPYLFWALHRIISDFRWRYAVHAAIALTLLNYSSWYLAAIAAIGVLVWFLFARPAGTSWREWVKPFIAIAALAGVLLLPLALCYRAAQAAGVETGHWGLRAIRGAPLLAFVLPSSLHPVLGRLTRLILGDPAITLENNVSVGIVALLLALWAARSQSRGHDAASCPPSPGALRALWATGIAGMVLALGPFLVKAGAGLVVLPIPLPLALQSRLGMTGKLGGLPVPLPAAVLAVLPVFSGMRVYQRFAALANLAIAALAAVGLSRIRAANPGRGTLAFAAAVILTLFEFAPWPFETASAGPRAVDRWLQKTPGQFTILEFPLKQAENGPHLYYSRFHGKRIAFGITSFMPRRYQEFATRSATLPDSEGIRALTQAEVRYVLVDQRADTAAHLDAFRASPHFRLETVLDSISVFSVTP
jgi:hypothetical protein